MFIPLPSCAHPTLSHVFFPCFHPLLASKCCFDVDERCRENASGVISIIGKWIAKWISSSGSFLSFLKPGLDPPFIVARYPRSHAAVDSGVVLLIKKVSNSQGRLGNVRPCLSPRPPPRIPFATSHREGEPAPDRETNFILEDPMVRVIDFEQNAEIDDSTSVPQSVPSSRVSR